MKMKQRKRFASLILVCAMICSCISPIGQVKAAEVYNEPLVQYDMSVDGDLLKDVSGHGYDAKLVELSASDVVTDEDGSKALKFNGQGYIKLPDCLKDNNNTITIQMTYKVGGRNNEGLLTLGTKNASTSGNNYLRFHPNTNSTAFLWESEVNNQNNAKATGSIAYMEGEYATATAVIDNGQLTYYLNGKKYGTLNMNGVNIQDILNTCDDRSDAIGFIGRPAWADHDPYFSGTLKSFEVYNYAVPEEEILWNTRTGTTPVVNYSMALTEDGKLKDNSGFGFDAELVGLDANAVVKDGDKDVLDFSNTQGYVNLPDNIIQGEEFTISATFKPAENENSAIWTLGTTTNNYVRIHPSAGNGLLFELVGNGVSKKLGDDGSIRINTDVYNTVTAVFYETGLAILYVNGEEAGRMEHGFKVQDILKNGDSDVQDAIGYIGRSVWDGDPRFSGKLAGFKVYERALSSNEIYVENIAYESSASTTKIVSNVEPKDVPNVTADREWREGMVTGNGHNGVINAGYPYSDTLIYQNIYLLMPSTSSRENPDFYNQLETVRQSVVTMQNNIPQIPRGFFYAYHPGPQLRLDMDESIQSGGTYSNYERWTDFETAEVGVTYTNGEGIWERKTFTSREDDVTITQINKSSRGTKINMELSLDNLSTMTKFWGDPANMQYKKIVADDASYIALVGKYPGNGDYAKGELKDGGYVGTAQVIVVGGKKEKVLNTTTSRDSQNVGADTDPRIKITDADAVYIIERTDRTWDMCKFDDFRGKNQYDLLDELNEQIAAVAQKYADAEKGFDYEAALAPHAKAHGDQFNAVKFNLNASAEDRKTSTETLLASQRNESQLNDALVERLYNSGRYAELCCSGYSAPRLSGMWTGEFNGGWRYIYTLDANVNLQVAPMNTGNIADAPIGYINFILRQLDDWSENAYNSYRMHDAIQPSVNTDGDSAIGIESDWIYPFQYWNAGGSWLLLPIYEYWQCHGNQKIPISDKVDLYKVRATLGVEDGGLSEAEVDKLMERGWLDLEQDILLPLLTKQANFWEQLMTPEYYMDAAGNPQYEKGKTELDVAAGEKYMIIPTYSPENAPRADGGYTWNAASTMNATMDISAARDGLSMTIAMEKAVGREGSEAAIAKWENLKSLLPDYQYDGEPGSEETYYGGGGALREWATPIYMEENRHRHISHSYVAWPAYETQHDEELAAAVDQALKNRNRLNSGGEKTTGHGWMHYALVQARLKNPSEVYNSMYQVINSDIYYSSMITDHNTNRQSDTYCTDTGIGMTAVVNEALVFSNTGEIELLPALPEQWKTGSMDGLMARTRAQVEKLCWDQEEGTVDAVIRSDIDQSLTLGCGMDWGTVVIEGNDNAKVRSGKTIKMDVKAGDTIKLHFTQEPSGEVDKEDLENLVKQCADVDTKLYTTETAQKFEQALKDAKAVLDNADATQADVDAAEDVLKAAKNGLKKEVPEVLADFDFDADGEFFDGGNAKATGTYTLVEHGDGKALKLDGSNKQYLTVVGTDGKSLLTDVEEMTVSYQIKPEKSRTNWGFFAAPNGNTQGYLNEHYLGITDIDGTTNAERYNNNGERPKTASYETGYNGWYHVTVVYSKNATTLYVDGVKVAEEASNYALTDILGKNSILYIGRSNWTAEKEYATALIDNYKIVSKALSADEVAKEADKYKDTPEPPTPEKKVESIAVTEPEKVEYLLGEELAADGMKVTVTYTDGTKEDITKGYDVKGYDPEKVGKQTITVSYEGKEAAFEIEILGLPFEDVTLAKECEWFYKEVYYNYYKGIMTGTDDTHFAPGANLARAQFAVILHRLNDKPAVEYTDQFPDVEKGIWYTDAILWAASTGVVTGYTDSGLFGPADNINREQMAVMMYRYAKYLKKDISVKADYSKFTDAASVNTFAKEAMSWAVGTGIITGKDNGTRLDPQGNASRAECAIIIQRFMERYDK